MNKLYISRAVLVCYDGEGLPAGDLPPAPPANPPTDGEIKPPASFTAEQQKEFNEALAKDRRKHQAALQHAEKQMQDLLTSKSLSEQERAKAEDALNTVQMQLRTKDQQAAYERKQLEEAHAKTLKDITEKVTHWENKYKDSTIARALQDAAVSGDAYNPAQLVTILRPMTKLTEENGEFKTIVQFPDTDATTGEPVMTARTPEEAVKRMKELPEVYGNLFKSNVVSGIGSHSATGGLTSGKDGKIDYKKLAQDPAKYRELREKNPAALGLR
jgi:hypothetical protein